MQLYAAILSYATCRYRHAPNASFHLILILLVELGTYVYRDLIPLATFNKRPIDGSEGSIFLVKMALLFGVSTIVPLCKPRRYIPLDPNVSSFPCSFRMTHLLRLEPDACPQQ
jgi:hypothetical protein